MNQAYILDQIESSSSILQGGKVNKNGKKNMSLRCRTYCHRTLLIVSLVTGLVQFRDKICCLFIKDISAISTSMTSKIQSKNGATKLYRFR